MERLLHLSNTCKDYKRTVNNEEDTNVQVSLTGPPNVATCSTQRGSPSSTSSRENSYLIRNPGSSPVKLKSSVNEAPRKKFCSRFWNDNPPVLPDFLIRDKRAEHHRRLVERRQLNLQKLIGSRNDTKKNDASVYKDLSFSNSDDDLNRTLEIKSPKMKIWESSISNTSTLDGQQTFLAERPSTSKTAISTETRKINGEFHLSSDISKNLSVDTSYQSIRNEVIEGMKKENANSLIGNLSPIRKLDLSTLRNTGYTSSEFKSTSTPIPTEQVSKRICLELNEFKLIFKHKIVYGTISSDSLKKDFKCRFGTSTESEDSMPDGKAPHFPQQPVARQNDDGSLELECFVDANPTPQVKWYYDNKEVENSGRFSANLANKGSDSYSAILTIKELADADAGAYRCAIVNPHGKGNANFNLKLTGFSSPTFVEKPQISSRDDGQVMVMEFRAKSILEPTFVWQKLVGGGAEEIIANSDRIKAVKKLEAGNVYYSALEIKEPTKDKDAGQFICTVKNESGKLTATFTVKFEVPEGAPSFTRKPQILQQTSSGGEPAICFDIGYSARMNPVVTWISPKSKKMKESSRIKFKTNDEGNGNFTAQLELTNYKAKDSGTYTCNIKNDAGEANVELTLNIEGPLDDYADDSEN